MPNYYEILGVAPTASPSEIRKAYVKIAREKHPDRVTDPEEKARAEKTFQDVTAAFNTLTSERSRSDYDASLRKPVVTAPEDIAHNAYTKGLALLEAKQYHDAVEMLRVAVHHAPAAAKHHVALGRALVANPNWTHEAVSALEQALRLDPKSADAHATLAAIYLRQGMRLRARRAAEAALAVKPSHPAAREVLDQCESEPSPDRGKAGGDAAGGSGRGRP